MNQIVVLTICTVASMMLVREIRWSNHTLAVLLHVMFVFSFVVRIALLIVIMLASAALLSVVGGYVMG
jgi:hypothetical protein